VDVNVAVRFPRVNNAISIRAFKEQGCFLFSCLLIGEWRFWQLPESLKLFGYNPKRDAFNNILT
jgi:hypothetical protein